MCGGGEGEKYWKNKHLQRFGPQGKINNKVPQAPKHPPDPAPNRVETHREPNEWGSLCCSSKSMAQNEIAPSGIDPDGAKNHNCIMKHTACATGKLADSLGGVSASGIRNRLLTCATLIRDYLAFVDAMKHYAFLLSVPSGLVSSFKF